MVNFWMRILAWHNIDRLIVQDVEFGLDGDQGARLEIQTGLGDSVEILPLHPTSSQSSQEITYIQAGGRPVCPF